MTYSWKKGMSIDQQWESWYQFPQYMPRMHCNFRGGDWQWDEDAKRARDIDGQPSLVLNQLLPYAHQIINDIRQTRPSIRVTPVDSGADVDTAEVMAGLIRNIERQSSRCKCVR